MHKPSYHALKVLSKEPDLSPVRPSFNVTMLRSVLISPPTLYQSLQTCCLEVNFLSVEHHLSSSEPHLLLIIKTLMSHATVSTPYSFPFYFLYPQFRSTAWPCRCASVRNDVTCFRAHVLEFSELSTWLSLNPWCIFLT